MTFPVLLETDATVPLLVGVTGHRDLRVEDCAALEAVVGEALDHVRARVPYTPLSVISSLAEGADRLVARVAIRKGARLVVPLPLPCDEYERDFKKEASRVEFAGLLAQASSVFFVGWQAGLTLEDVRGDGALRVRQYAAAGAWVVRHCRILVALWDGVELGSPGGTWQVVKWARSGVPSEFSGRRDTLDALQTRMLIHIATPRTSRPVPSHTAFSLVEAPPTSVSVEAGAPTDAMRRIDEFNADAHHHRSALRPDTEHPREERTPRGADLPSTARADLGRYHLANALALHFQKRALRSTRWVFGTTFAALVSFEVFAHVSGLAWPWLAAYLALFGAAIGLLRAARTSRAEAKHLDYRALAEGERVQLFWRLAGIEAPASDFYLRLQRSELDWVRDALAAWAAVTPRPVETPVDAGVLARLDIVRELWVKEQADWLGRSAKWKHARETALRLQSRVAFYSGLSAAAALLVIRVSGVEGDAHTPHLMIVATTVLLLMAAITRTLAEKHGLEGEARRYATSAAIFARGLEQLDGALKDGRVDVKVARQIVFDLGREALVEHASWFLAHRERPLEVPAG